MSWVLPSRFEAMVLAAALARLGAVQNPILPIYRTREVALHRPPEWLHGHGRARHVPRLRLRADGRARPPPGSTWTSSSPTRTCPRATRRRCRRIVPAFDELRWLFYSSGTTADPKGAKHSDHSMSAPNAGMQWSMQVGPDDKAAVVFPITHVGGLIWLFNAMETGVELLMVESVQPGRDPEVAGRSRRAPAPAPAPCSGRPTSTPSARCPPASG